MKERPILFSAPMVRALLDGSKTQTRRLVKGHAFDWLVRDGFTPDYVADPANFAPFGVPGDRLWVRETWYCDDYRVQKGPYLEVDGARDLTVYFADHPRPYEAEQPIWRPSIHMPRWACRVVLEVVSVRVERLQDISSADVIAEGLSTTLREHDAECDLRDQWRELWESTGGDWKANPWVWVVEFKRVTP